MKHIKFAATLLAAAVLVAALTAGAVALRRSSGGTGAYKHDIIDRVRFTASPTDLSVTGAAPGEEIELMFTLTAQKTEADFYAMIHKITPEGIAFTSIRYQSEDGTEAYAPRNLLLPAENGKPTEVRWTVSILFTPDTLADFDFSLEIDYTAGLTEATADEHLLRVPLHVTFG